MVSTNLEETMKNLLYYFSATGNTKFVADKFQEQFKIRGEQLELINIEKVESVDLSECGCLIIGTPIHAELIPKIIIDFINKLPEATSLINCIIYSTQGSKNAAGSVYIRKILAKKGYNILINTSFRMSNNYYFSFGVERTEEEIKNYCKSAEEKVISITEKFFKNESVKEKSSNMKILFGKMTSNGFNKFLPKLSANLTSTENCSKCGLCLRNCPKGNITFEDGRAIFHSKCIMCTRCIHLCPSNVIRYKGKKINQNQKSLIKHLDLK
jgi:ferredoxin/protein involved in ribonucleotide reduction